jgi:hypothetical protein
MALAAYGPRMASSLLSRRRLLQLGALAPVPLLAACGQQRRQLLAVRGDLPTAWASRLPGGWALRQLETPAAVQAGLQGGVERSAALVQLWDGWAGQLSRGALQPFGGGLLLSRLDPLAGPVSRLFAPAGTAAVAFPWALDPWVLLLRDRPDLERRRQEGWGLLLDPSLRGKLVLPSSPRVTISLVQADPARLRLLRRAALAHDERNGLNLLLSGEAEAQVLPRRLTISLLRRDPRLAVVLPSEGAPLGWNLLLRPSGSPDPAPQAWLEEVLQAPLLPRLLAAGWVPPLPHAQLERAAVSLPPSQRALLVPPEAVLQRSWSLPPLTPPQREDLQALWDGAAPAAS